MWQDQLKKNTFDSVFIIPCIQKENGADHTAGTQANHEMSPPPAD